MKKLIITIILFVGLIVNGQTSDYTYTSQGGTTSVNKFTHGLQGITKVNISTGTDLNLTTNNSNQLVVSKSKLNGNNYINDNAHDEITLKEKTKGLTAIYAGGKDDTNGFGLSIKREGDVLFIKDLKSHMQRSSLFLSLPKHIIIVTNLGNLGSLTIEGFTAEVEVKTNVGAIKMKDVTGPITAHSNVGDINIEFSEVSQTSPITITTNVSEIDVTMPTDTKANIELSTSETVYTNFDIETPEKGGLKAVRGSKKIQSALNNGGVQIKLKSNLGNIYLRKK